MIGSKLGHYEITRKLGSGGMGVVYAARDTKLDRDVALKILPPEVADNPERRRRFEREARSAAALNHPNIVTLYSVEEHESTVFITMELVRGETVAARIVPGGMTLDSVIRIGVQLADAVAEAHEHGVIHRDLKPQNVMIASDGVIKVLDFGLAKPVPSADDLESEETATSASTTSEGRILGTPAYMSPEQAEGKSVDHRTDVFSLGVVLYEMATGSRPFEGDTAMSIIASVIKHTPPPPESLRAGLPKRLSRIVERCLVKDRRRRYQSARDLAADLEELWTEAQELTSSTAASVSATRPTGSRAARALVTFAVVALAAGAGAFAYRSLARATAADIQTNPARERRPRTSYRFRRLTTEYGAEVNPQIAPDGTWFVYAASVGNQLDVFRQRVGGRARTNLTERSAQDDSEPAISPDGDKIAFRSERDGGGIYVMGATGEAVRRVTDMGHHPSWSPDGKRLAVSSVPVYDPRIRGLEGQAWIVDPESGEKRRLEAGKDAVLSSWFPSGSRLAFYGANSLFTVPSEGGKPDDLFEQERFGWTPWVDRTGGYLYYSGADSGELNVWRLPIDLATGRAQGEPEPVTAAVSEEAAWPSASRDGRRVVFSTRRTTANIAKIRFDSKRGMVLGEPILLTRGTNDYLAPDVSRDGHWLTFGAGLFQHDENTYVLRTDGSELHQLTTDVKTENRLPRWTPSGQIVFYSSRSGEWKIWSVARDGSGLRRVSDPPGTLVFVIPAHDGKRIATMQRGVNLVVFDASRPFSEQSAQRYDAGPAPGELFWPTDWSPDDKRLVGYTAAGVYTFDLETKRYEKLTGSGACPRTLSDGKRLVYSKGEMISTGLAIVDIASKKETPLYAPAVDKIFGHFSVSSDERWIYFSRQTEDGDVWLAELEPQP